MRFPIRRRIQGTTLPEVMISAVLIATFFASIFEVNAVCLRYVNASKEAVAAIQGVQDRLETLRNLAFTDLIAPAVITPLLATPSNSAVLATRVVETVTISDYTSGSPSVTYTRPAGASVTPTVAWTGGSSFPTATTLLKVNVKYTWALGLGGRARSEETEAIISNGTKK